jgi:hypothetical protein
MISSRKQHPTAAAFVEWHRLHGSGYCGIKAEGEALIRAGAVSPEEYIAAVIQ